MRLLLGRTRTSLFVYNTLVLWGNVHEWKKEKKKEPFMWFWLLVKCPPTSIYKQTIINKKWQSTIEISHFLCLHAWPSRVNTHMVGIALKFKYIIWKFKKRKMQERLHCAWKQWCPIHSFNCRCFRFSLVAVISVQKWKWRGLGKRLSHFVLITERKREQNVNKDTNLRELHILPL